ncbi:MAG: porin family protein [Ignavibacteriales bacterium]|nr:porin family protein [Ignavibacteriales bacterium]
MKKTGFSILLLCIFSSAAFAQLGISKGLIGGLNMASLSGADVSSDAKGVTGYAAGLYLEINIPGPFSIEPEALYSMKGSKIAIGNNTFTDNYAYVDIPVLLKYFLPIPVVRTYLYAGPSYSILLSAKRKTEGSTVTNSEVDVKNAIAGNDLGAVVGLGIGFSGLRVDARYNLGLSTIDKNGTYKMFNRVAAVYVGIGF